jgi:hypothetical protein
VQPCSRFQSICHLADTCHLAGTCGTVLRLQVTHGVRQEGRVNQQQQQLCSPPLKKTKQLVLLNNTSPGTLPPPLPAPPPAGPQCCLHQREGWAGPEVLLQTCQRTEKECSCRLRVCPAAAASQQPVELPPSCRCQQPAWHVRVQLPSLIQVQHAIGLNCQATLLPAALPVAR